MLLCNVTCAPLSNAKGAVPLPPTCIPVPASLNMLQQVEKLKYLGLVFTGDGRRNKKIDARSGKAKTVLRELYRLLVTKQELSHTAKF